MNDDSDHPMWGALRSLAHGHDPLTSRSLPHIFDHMSINQRQSAARYFADVRGLPKCWGVDELILLGLFEDLLGVALHTKNNTSYGVYVRCAASMETCFLDRDTTFESLNGQMRSRPLVECRREDVNYAQAEDTLYPVANMVLADTGHIVTTSERGHPEIVRHGQRTMYERERYTSASYALSLDDTVISCGEATTQSCRFIWRVETDGSLYDALRVAFHLPDTWSTASLYPSKALRLLRPDMDAAIPELASWLQDSALPPTLLDHLSNFFESHSGDQHDFSLSKMNSPHIPEDPRRFLSRKQPLDTFFYPLQLLGATETVMVWDYEYVDTLDCVAVVAFE